MSYAEQLAFAATLDNVTARVLPELTPAGRALLVAHGCLESGFGKAAAYRTGFNAFNLTAGPAWRGAKWTQPNGDSDARGRRITQTWRAYPTLEACILDYWDFLGPLQNRGRYTPARAALEEGNLLAFSRLLHVAGYYELEPALYAKRLLNISRGLAEHLYSR